MSSKKFFQIITIYFLLIVAINNLYAEQCVDGVKQLVSWSEHWKGNADDFPNNAERDGLIVNDDPSGCNSDEPCILFYHPDYGYGIDYKHGHVAVLYNDASPYNIQDSNGVCGGDRAICSKNNINFNKASIIHPPPKIHIEFKPINHYENLSVSSIDQINFPEINTFSGCLKYRNKAFIKGSIMVFKAGKYSKKVKLDSKGCFNIPDLNSEKPFTMIIRKSK